MNNRIIALLLSLSMPLMAAEPVWIDVSSPEEYTREHLAGAIHIPYTRIAQGVTARYPDKATPLKLYDRDDHRAQLAREALQTLGYRQVSDKGGLEELKASGLATQQADSLPDLSQPPSPMLEPVSYTEVLPAR
ncbi:rhodanese-like domain-containing protein [Oceanisphaera sp. KMM 10153]|uniref:rhodanese-like domain-containing protein n=1 Tax=Oceanisphaera submarina TaxID=3390193 RepID=UPI0039771C36